MIKLLAGVSQKDKRRPSGALNDTLQDVTSKLGLSPLERDDWTSDLPSSSHVRFFKSADWPASPLGPMEGWSNALRIHVFTVLADSRPSVLYWGPGRIAIYNEAFIPLAGKTHPFLMGTGFAANYPEIWDTFQTVFTTVETTGVAFDVDEIPLFVERSGFLEETYFTGNFNPLRGNTGKIEGFYNAVHEVTKVKIGDRRRAMLNSMQVPSSFHTGTFESYVIPFLEFNDRDITMALLYKADEETVPGKCLLLLQGSIGVPSGHPLVEEAVINGSHGLVSLLKKDQDVAVIPVDDRFKGVEWRSFGEPSETISVLRLSGAGRNFGYLVVGNNPRLKIDEDHLQFMRDLSSKVSSIAASLVSAEESRKRSERLLRELADSEKQIRKFAQHASVGMINLDVDGTTIWANDEYYNITRHTREEESQYQYSFIDVFAEEDQPKALDSFNRLIKGEPNVSIELRLKKMFCPPSASGDPHPAYVLSLSFPFLESSRVKSIMTCITNVSSLKWAESIEARKAADAREAKRRQEEFIDLVSHELRNPLSAIFQLSDTIITSFLEDQMDVAVLRETIRSNVDAAETILMCAKHQKRIVDDVLTLSKLEYMMLSVSPRPVHIPTLIERSVQMFSHDIMKANIKLTISAETSLQEGKKDWVLCDPSRVTQIFINLLTNAIKFTRNETPREISIRYGVVLSEPRKGFPEVKWAFNQRQQEQENIINAGPLFLTLEVKDTGVGMSPEQITKLFKRFQQASPKTSIKYGGSGLGLFISQRLAEKQGGEIGVRAELGKGSTFVFYIEVRDIENDSKEASLHSSRPVTIRSTSSPAVIGLSDVDLNKIHVLLVEDNIVNQQITRRQLTTAGCVVYVANHGLEALDFLKSSDAWRDKSLQSKHLDIILMDWEMPVMDGLTASRKIRALQESGEITRHIEIVATTANAREEQIQSALASGIDCVISKPFMVADLLNKMRERLKLNGTWISP